MGLKCQANVGQGHRHWLNNWHLYMYIITTKNSWKSEEKTADLIISEGDISHVWYLMMVN
jgi:hypothetical protein